MKIRKATKEDIPALYEFNHRMYPERENYKEIIDFWLGKSSNEIENIVIAIEDDGRIRGQQFFSSMSYYIDGSEISSTWAFDLIVDEELRAGSQGFSLMWKCKKIHSNNMSSGSNDISLPINLKIGNKHLGDIKKYVGLSNPLWLFTSLFRGNIKPNKYPQQIKASNFVYKKIDNPQDLPSYTQGFNSQLLEITRKKDFLKWRFFTKLHDYVFYKNEENDDYLVVRTIIKQHITALVLVDYRCQLIDGKSFYEIMKAFVRLASQLRIAVLITGSSMAEADNICEAFHLKAVGRNRPILGMIDCDDSDSWRKNRDKILLTLADSDGDITW